MKKNPLLWLKLACSLILLPCHVIAIEQQKIDLVKPVQGTKYEISNIPENYPLRIPITFQQGVKTVKSRLLGVSFNNRNYQIFMQAFTVDVENTANNENTTPAIIINSNSRNLEQGIYQLTIDIQFDGADNSSVHQILILELTLPSAKLQQPGTITIEQTRGLFGSEIVGKPALFLIENSGRQTSLNNISVKQIALVAENNQATTGLVNFNPPEQIQVLPGKAVEIGVSLAGDFPLGTTKGTALIKSSQMAEPVTVPFEIKARRHWGFIIAFIVIGLLASFATRIWAQRQIDLYNARSKALDAIKTIKQELLRRSDDIFGKRVKSAITKIEEAAAGAKIEVIETTITEANKEFAEALKDLETRLTEAQALLKTLSQAATAQSSLPKEFAEVFAFAGLNSAEQDIADGNAASARQKIEAFTIETWKNINNVLVDWKTNNVFFLQQLIGISPLVSTPALAEKVTQKINALLDKFDDLDFTGQQSSEQIVIAVDKLREIQIKIRETLLQLQLTMNNTNNFLKVQFSKVNKKEETSINNLFRKLDEFQNKIGDWVEFTSEKESEFQKELSDLKSLWEAALTAQMKSDKEAGKEVEKMLSEDKFREATFAVIQFLSSPAEKLLDARKSTALPEELSVNMDFSDSLLKGETSAGDNMVIFKAEHKETSPIVFEVFKAGSLFNFVLAKTIGFLVAGIGIVMVGYVLFADKFIGTISDLLAVFVWAFGIDLSINAFLEAGKKTIKF